MPNLFFNKKELLYIFEEIDKIYVSIAYELADGTHFIHEDEIISVRNKLLNRLYGKRKRK